jgi:putative tryptophan/tyrosine transport system substrate-binding protein
MQCDWLKRRDFLTLLGGGAAGWPLAARAQQSSRSVIGLLSSIFADVHPLAAFHRGLAEQGYIENRNLAIEYRFAEGRYDRLPALASELVSRPVDIIAAVGSSPAALAAKSATRTIPIVFFLGVDVVKLGLVGQLQQAGRQRDRRVYDRYVIDTEAFGPAGQGAGKIRADRPLDQSHQ